jgi:hypothetical protein
MAAGIAVSQPRALVDSQRPLTSQPELPHSYTLTGPRASSAKQQVHAVVFVFVVSRVYFPVTPPPPQVGGLRVKTTKENIHRRTYTDVVYGICHASHVRFFTRYTSHPNLRSNAGQALYAQVQTLQTLPICSSSSSSSSSSSAPVPLPLSKRPTRTHCVETVRNPPPTHE